MATAVEMTIALGRTIYGAPGAETGSDERIEGCEAIEGCETRVSVTWRLTENEQNLPLTASLLAEKAVQALETADRTVRCKVENKEEKPAAIRQVPVQHRPPGTPASPPPAHGAGSTHGAGSCDGEASTSVTAPESSTASRSCTAAYVPRITNPHITKPQSLAIQSLCTRHGIADWELRRIVWEQYGKKDQSELTKDQAGELLNILQLRSANGGAAGSAFA